MEPRANKIKFITNFWVRKLWLIRMQCTILVWWWWTRPIGRCSYKIQSKCSPAMKINSKISTLSTSMRTIGLSTSKEDFFSLTGKSNFRIRKCQLYPLFGFSRKPKFYLISLTSNKSKKWWEGSFLQQCLDKTNSIISISWLIAILRICLIPNWNILETLDCSCLSSSSWLLESPSKPAKRWRIVKKFMIILLINSSRDIWTYVPMMNSKMEKKCPISIDPILKSFKSIMSLWESVKSISAKNKKKSKKIHLKFSEKNNNNLMPLSQFNLISKPWWVP